MESDASDRSRRRFLRVTGSASLVSLVGCLGDADSPSAERPEGWCLDELSDSVPDDQATAESIGGIERDPDAVRTKDDVEYRCHPVDGEQCSNCKFYVPSTTSDNTGACTELEGEVRSVDWCELHEYESEGNED